MLRRLLRTNDDVVGLVLRLALGIVIFPHGAQKMLGWFGGPGFAGTLGMFEQVFGLPAVVTFLVILAEFLGSLGLILGFLTRVAAVGVGLDMLGAVWLVHRHVGFFMNWTGAQQGEGFEYHILALGIVVALLLAGGGRASVDRVLEKRFYPAGLGA
jgi:putative oxidoreductase